MSHTFETKFGLGSRVFIDNDTRMEATVAGIRVYAHGAPTYEVTWYTNGMMHAVVVNEWRLQCASLDSQE